MKVSAHFFIISRWILRRMIKFSTRVLEKIKSHAFVFSNFFPKIVLLWDKMEKYCSARRATGDKRMRFASWITKITDTHSEYIILIAFPQQRWLHERGLILCLYVLTGRHNCRRKMEYEPCKVHLLIQLPNNQNFSIQATEWIAVIFMDLIISICFHIEHRLIFFFTAVETECVYSAILTECLNIIRHYF